MCDRAEETMVPMGKRSRHHDQSGCQEEGAEDVVEELTVPTGADQEHSQLVI